MQILLTTAFLPGPIVATYDDTRSLYHRLVLEIPEYQVWLHHSPMEVYLTWDLQVIPHHYQNYGPGNGESSSVRNRLLRECGGSVMIVSDRQSLVKIPGVMMVARPTSSVYASSFPPETFQFPISKVFGFMMRNGHDEPKRSNGWRVNLCCGGQANDITVSGFRPKALCGDQIFRTDPDGEMVRLFLGKVVDGLCTCAKNMTTTMGKPHYTNLKRYLEYADQLRKFLYGKAIYVENITLQLLDLTAGHTCARHLDCMNDPRASYNRVRQGDAF